MTDEGEIKQAICEYLERLRVFFWLQIAAKTPGRRNSSKRIRKGISDILGILSRGRMLAIEVKTPDGKASLEQIAFIDEVNRLGGVGMFASSVEDVARKLEGNL